MQPWAERFYKGKEWQECRKAFLQSKFFLCERCGGVATIAHHKERLAPENINDPNITLNWEKLEALCQECHNREHHGEREVTREGLMFNGRGELVDVSNTTKAGDPPG
jgi:5-methylcytosine-specific restriction endonuclease McrA